jgi:hypothetical protein
VFTRTGTTWAQDAYIKASNAEPGDLFGTAGPSIALSGDGHTLAIGAASEDSAATGVDGAQASNAAIESGAVYVFVRGTGGWAQQAFVKASNTDANDQFGYGVALSGDGSTLAVGARHEASSARGLDGDQVDNSLFDAGAAYVFTRTANTWSQQHYVKAPTPTGNARFGHIVAMSASATTLVVGAPNESSPATGLDGDQMGTSAPNAGAVYIFE